MRKEENSTVKTLTKKLKKKQKWLPTSGDSGTLAEPELQNDAEATPALGLSLSYEMMEGLLLFKF